MLILTLEPGLLIVHNLAPNPSKLADENTTVNILGLQWNTITDTLQDNHLRKHWANHQMRSTSILKDF